MEEPFSFEWTTMGIPEIILVSKSALTVYWFASPPNTELSNLCSILNIQARKQHITTSDTWEKFVQTYLTVHYHDKSGNDANWYDTDALHYTIKEWSSKQSITRNQEFHSNVLISIYDTVKEKGVLIDGNKRATILTKENQTKKKPIFDIMVYEWHGDHVNMIFPTDLCQFYRADFKTREANAKTKGIA